MVIVWFAGHGLLVMVMVWVCIVFWSWLWPGFPGHGLGLICIVFGCWTPSGPKLACYSLPCWGYHPSAVLVLGGRLIKQGLGGVSFGVYVFSSPLLVCGVGFCMLKKSHAIVGPCALLSSFSRVGFCSVFFGILLAFRKDLTEALPYSLYVYPGDCIDETTRVGI